MASKETGKMTAVGQDTLKTRRSLEAAGQTVSYYSLEAAAGRIGDVSRLPYSMKVLLENLLRFEDGVTVTVDDIQALADWQKDRRSNREMQYRPARVLLQDFTGVPCVVDLAAMRDAISKLGGDPQKINPLVPVHLVIDHSVMVDEFGTPKAFEKNVELEYQRNMERYEFLRWGSKALNNFSAVPPGTGICHQVNLENIAQTVWTSKDEGGQTVAYPDTLVGTDSHTTMVNGLGVLGWGVGGIEAEAAMLGQPVSMLIPEVVGFRLSGTLKEGITATDLVLPVTQMLRAQGVGTAEDDGRSTVPSPDTLVGTDRPPTMVTGLGVLGWGVGGIEAEAAMLGQPVSMLIPEVVGFRLSGTLKEGITATDLVLTVTQMLRAKGVVGRFVEFYGPGLDALTLADRATIANMAPEYGATCGFFPIDQATINYLRLTGRSEERIALVEAYAKAQGMWRDATSAEPVFTDTLELDISSVEPSLAGPKRPQDRVLLSGVSAGYNNELADGYKKGAEAAKRVPVAGESFDIGHGDVVIAAITSCTNTSNPSTEHRPLGTERVGTCRSRWWPE